MSLDQLMYSLGLAKKAPDKTIVPLDPNTTSLIDESVNRMNVPLEQTQKEMQGSMMEQGESFLESPEEARSQFANMGESPYMGDAIKSIHKSQSRDSLQRIRDEADYQNRVDHAAKLKSSWQLTMAKRNIEIDNLAKQAEANIQAEALRAKFLSSVFQTAGRVTAISVMGNKKNKQKFTDNNMGIDNDPWGGHAEGWKNDLENQMHDYGME